MSRQLGPTEGRLALVDRIAERKPAMFNFTDWATGEYILTEDEHNVLMAKLNSAIATNRAVQHICEELADGFDNDMPWSERGYMISHTSWTVYNSAPLAMASAIGDAIVKSVDAADTHKAVADEIWSVITH